MIKFDKFVAAIQEAIVKANESLITRNNGNFVKMYFNQVGGEDELQEKLDKALASLKAGDERSKDDHIKALTEARDALSGGNVTEEKNQTALPNDSYTPKLVSLQYPFYTDEGVEYRDIQVPLITLNPISSTEIKEVILETDIVISESDDEVQLNFERKLFSRMLGNAKPGRLKIKVSPREPAEGTQIVIEGFEKLLRSQIPQ